MADLFINKLSKVRQCMYSVLLVGVVSVICYGVSQYVGYRVISFILLITVSLIAVVFDIIPVLITAVLTALIWDFFFIPPYFTLSVGSAEDLILLLMYLVIALISAALTYKIRQVEKAAQKKEGKANTVRLYNTMLNSLSHELRTPIAAIIGATDNLQHNSSRLTNENRNELVGEISKASFRLNQQVENLLNMSRLESGFIAPKSDWCDISEVIYDTVKRVEENKVQQQIEIAIHPELPLFRLDDGMLEQVLYNLVNNAALYTPPGSRIIISAICERELLKLTIEDDGPGFPAGEMTRVFDKFYRLDSGRPGGTGLGLSIVKGFTEALGGTIHLQNKRDGGALFTISITAPASYLKNLNHE